MKYIPIVLIVVICIMLFINTKMCITTVNYIKQKRIIYFGSVFDVFMPVFFVVFLFFPLLPAMCTEAKLYWTGHMDEESASTIIFSVLALLLNIFSNLLYPVDKSFLVKYTSQSIKFYAQSSIPANLAPNKHFAVFNCQTKTWELGMCSPHAVLFNQSTGKPLTKDEMEAIHTEFEVEKRT